MRHRIRLPILGLAIVRIALAAELATAQTAWSQTAGGQTTTQMPTRDQYGRQCISDVRGDAEPVRNSPSDLYEHVVTAINVCANKMVLKVCYERSERCKTLEVPGNSRASTILGFEPHGEFFKYRYEEVKR